MLSMAGFAGTVMIEKLSNHSPVASFFQVSQSPKAQIGEF